MASAAAPRLAALSKYARRSVLVDVSVPSIVCQRRRVCSAW
jgi:hypothetical protein